MPDRLSFQLDLTGEMASALRGVVAQMDKADSGMGKLRASSSGLDKELGKLHAGAKPLIALEWGNLVNSFAGLRREASGQWVFNLAEGMRSFADAARVGVERVGQLVFAIGKAVASEQDLSLAERLTGGESGASMIREIADSFQNTRFDDGTVRRALLPLFRAGIRDRGMLDAIATASADIEALTAGDVKLSDAAAALGKIAIKRDLGERQLEALGLNAQDTFAALGAGLGMTADQAKKRAGAGQIAGEDLLGAVLGELARKQGGSIGTASLEAGKTLGASFQRLSDLPENLMKLANGTPAMAAFQKGLDDFVKLMQGPTGAAVMQSLAGALKLFVDAVGGLASYFAEKVAATNTYDRLKEQGGITGAVAHVPFLRLILGGTDDYQDTMREEMAKVGVAAGDGVSQGMSESLAGVGSDAGAQVVADFAGPKGIDAHSPSRKFTQLGQYAAEGFEEGMGDLTAPTMQVQPSASRTVRGGHVFQFYVSGNNAREIVDELEPRVEAILARHYDRAEAVAA